MENNLVRILLIEDNVADADLMQEMLSNARTTSFEVERVSHLATGLERLGQKDFDIMLLDLMLPDSHGYSTFARARTRAPEVPIVVLSGLADEAVAIRALREGAQDYLVKGEVRFNLLIRAIHYAVERNQIEIELRRRNRELNLLNRASRALNSSLDLDRVLATIMEEVRRLLEVVACSVWLVDRSTGEMVCRQATGSRSELVKGWRLAPGEGLAGWVASTGESLIIEDATSDDRHFRGVAQKTDLELHSVLTVPLRAKRETIGVLQAVDSEVARFDRGHLTLLELLAVAAASAIENARLYQEVRDGRDRLQALSHRLVEVQEMERRHVARELHDEIGQTLTGLKLVLNMAAGASTDELEADLSEAQALVDEVMSHVRDLSQGLRPAMLDDLGLLPALLWHFKRYTSQTNIEVDFAHHNVKERRFAPELETAAYRIVQEALTNAARHASVGEVQVRIEVDDDTMTVQIADQGIGFDPEAALAASSSSGLVGMSERSSLLGGTLTIDSSPESSTRLVARLPLDARLPHGEKAVPEHDQDQE